MSSALAKAYMEIRGDTSHLPADLQRARSMLTSSVASMANIAGGLLAATGIQRFASMALEGAKTFITFNSSLEQYRISLGVMLKDQAKANQLIEDVQKMASTTPFSTDSLIKGIQRLKAYGFETSKLLPMMRTIGDAASASPEGMESGIQRISIALGQINSKGKLATQEINQLTEAGIPAWEILATRLNKSVSAVMDMVEKRQITSEQAISALTAGMNDKFGGMMAKQSQTFSGMWSTIMDNTKIAMGRIGEPVFEALKEVMQGLIGSNGMGGLVEGMRSRVQIIVDLFKDGFIGIKTFFGPTVDAISSQAAVIGEVISNIARQAQESFQGIGEIISGVWRNVFGESLGSMVKSGFLTIMDWLSVFTTDFTATWQIIGNYLSDVWYTLEGTWANVWNTMKDIAMGVVTGLAAGWSALIGNLMSALEDAERIWSKLRGEGGWSTKDRQIFAESTAADAEVNRLETEATRKRQSAATAREEVASGKGIKKDAFGNNVTGDPSYWNAMAKLRKANEDEQQASGLRKQAQQMRDKATQLRQLLEDRRSGKVDGTKNVYDEYAKGAARGTAMNQVRSQAERDRIKAEREAQQQELRERTAALTTELRRRRDMKRIAGSTVEANDVDEFGNPIVRLDENHNPIGAKGKGRIALDGDKKKLPSADVFGQMKQGSLDELYKSIQSGLGKKSPGDETLVSAARTTIEEKQARNDAYKAIKDFSGRDMRPRAT